jgi:hypothetical protein
MRGAAGIVRVAYRTETSLSSFLASVGTSQSRLGSRANQAAVRPAASPARNLRSHSLLIEERVKIVGWTMRQSTCRAAASDTTRGHSFDPRAFTW